MKNYAIVIAPLSVATFLLLTALVNAGAMAIVAAIASGAVGLIVLRRYHPVTSLSTRSKRILLFIGAVGCIVIACFCWPSPNWIARHQLRAELMTMSGTSEVQLSRLERFVRIGDNIHDVNNRLTPTPSRDRKDVKRPTCWSLGLDGVNLELAIESDGRVVGIGRYIWDRDDEPVWYAPPQWYHPVSQADLRPPDGRTTVDSDMSHLN